MNILGMNDSWSWAQGSICYELVRVMNDSRSSTQGSSCYEQLRVVIDLNDSMLSAQSSRCYEQLRVVDDMNDLGSCEVWSLDALNTIRLRMI